MEVQYFHQARTTAFVRGVEGSLHRTKDMSHKPNSMSRQVQRKSAKHIRTASGTTTRQQHQAHC